MKKKHDFDWFIKDLDKTDACHQIEKFVIDNIKSGTLSYGDQVLSYRALAELNEVSISTVKKAFNRLKDKKWIVGIPGSGTTVTDNSLQYFPKKVSIFPEKFPTTLNSLKHILLPDENYIKQPFIAIGADFPDPFLFPEEKFTKYKYQHCWAGKSQSQIKMLDKFDFQELKMVVLKELNIRRKFGVTEQMIHLIKGRQTCLNRVFKVLLQHGDTVINTSVYDVMVNEALRKRKVEIINVSRLNGGFLEKVKEIIALKTVRAIYIRTLASFPERHMLSEECCQELVELAVKHKICIIEEDDDHEFGLDKLRKPLATYDHAGFVVCIDTLSRVNSYTTQLKVVIASAELIYRLQKLPKQSLEGRDLVKESALADFIENGHLEEYVRAVRAKAQHDAYSLNWILSTYLKNHVTYTKPSYGLSFWVKFDDRFDLNIVLKRLEQKGVVIPYHPNNQITRKKVNFMLLGIGTFEIRVVEALAKILAKILDEYY